MIELSKVYLYLDVADEIDRVGAEEFLKNLNSVKGHQAQMLSNAVLEDHAHEYDNKKAALLRRKE